MTPWVIEIRHQLPVSHLKPMDRNFIETLSVLLAE
jgi:hypothetical protein